MKSLFTLVLILAVGGCATVKTLPPGTAHVDIAHEGKRSYCQSIPRIYSGFSYNLCKLHGEPSRQVNIGSTFNDVPFVVIDGSFSLIADTLALPYTLYTQNKHGSIDVN
jgi:uncharacterized protein YceK